MSGESKPQPPQPEPPVKKLSLWGYEPNPEALRAVTGRPQK